MTKVQKLFQNKTPQAGYLSTLAHYLSKLYILPLNINYQEGTIKFAFLSFRTLITVLFAAGVRIDLSWFRNFFLLVWVIISADVGIDLGWFRN